MHFFFYFFYFASFLFFLKLVIIPQVVLNLKFYSQLSICSLYVKTMSEEKISHSIEALHFFLVVRIPKAQGNKFSLSVFSNLALRKFKVYVLEICMRFA